MTMPASNEISLLDGSTFVVSRRSGDIEATSDEPDGLFFRDTRHLSRWRLTVDGAAPEVLSVDDVDYFAAQFFLYPPTGTIYENPYLSVIRRRYVGDGFHEDITVLNHREEAIELDLRLEPDADFADLFEVKDALEKPGEVSREVEDHAIVLRYRRDGFERETRISASAEADVGADALRFRGSTRNPSGTPAST